MSANSDWLPVGFAFSMLLVACYAPALHPWLAERLGSTTASVSISAVLLAASVIAVLASPVLDNPVDFSSGTMLWGVSAGVLAFVLAMLAYTLNTAVFGLSPPTAAQAIKPSGPVSLSAILLMVSCAAIAEEILFRGMIQNAVESIASAWLSVLATAALFAAYHLNIFQLLPTLVLGLVLGIVQHRIGLPAAVIAHLVFNLGGATLMALSGRSS